MTPTEQEIFAIFLREYPQDVLHAVAPLLLQQITNGSPLVVPVRAKQEAALPAPVPQKKKVGRPRGSRVLTPAVRQKIIAIRQHQGLSPDRIAAQLRLARSTVANFMAEEKKAGRLT